MYRQKGRTEGRKDIKDIKDTKDSASGDGGGIYIHTYTCIYRQRHMYAFVNI